MNISARPSRLKVLVVDDSTDTADMLARLIELDLPCSVSTAYDGEQAVRKAREDAPDVVILDLQMPVMDGLEAARQIKAALPGRKPLLVVMTGKAGVAEDLVAIDGIFDHSFAKPPDLTRLMSLLSTAIERRQGTFRRANRVDFGEVFTRAARHVLPATVGRGLVFAFDVAGPQVALHCEVTQLYRSVHRQMTAAQAALQSGFVMYRSHVQRDGDELVLVMTAAGTGQLTTQAALADVVRALGVTFVAPRQDAAPATWTGSGVCVDTGAAVEFSCNPREGVLVRARWHITAPQCRNEYGGRRLDATLWLVDSTGYDAAWLLRRFQRMGWRVQRFNACAEAMGELAAHGPPVAAGSPASPALPNLVVVVEDSAGPSEGWYQAVSATRAALPTTTRVVLAMLAGSPTLRGPPVPGTEALVYPFSPRDLRAFTRAAQAAPNAGTVTTDAEWLPADEAHKLSVMVVDDNEVNRIVARGLLEVLGYEVTTANDGLDAVEQCSKSPPDAVLMDLDMNVLGGLEATRRLRSLQSTGRLAPFGIVACTAHDDKLDACLSAGMDGYLTKPLKLGLLRSEMVRVTHLA